MGDDNEDYCDGDPTDIDWSEVERLAELQAEAGSDPVKNLALLHEMYGDELRVL